jgi:hypothetical protein
MPEVMAIGGGDIVRYGWPLILVAIGFSILLGDRFQGQDIPAGLARVLMMRAGKGAQN